MTHKRGEEQRGKNGEEIIIARAGKVVAKLVSSKPIKKCRFGGLRGKIKIASDFDAHLPKEVIAEFEGSKGK